MNGPCGEIAPALLDKSSAEGRRIGRRIGEAAARAVAGSPLRPITRLADDTREILLPVRDDLLDAEGEARELERLRERLACEREMPLHEAKRVAERVNFLRTGPFLREKWLAGEPGESGSRRKVTARLGCLALNDIRLIAFPGETFCATAERVKTQSGRGKVMTVTEHDRTLTYVVPPDEYRRGGYEAVCCLTSPDAEPMLASAALELARM